jgi:hypothetical protein
VRELGTRARLQKDDGGWRISAKAGVEWVSVVE